MPDVRLTSSDYQRLPVRQLPLALRTTPVVLAVPQDQCRLAGRHIRIALEVGAQHSAGRAYAWVDLSDAVACPESVEVRGPADILEVIVDVVEQFQALPQEQMREGACIVQGQAELEAHSRGEWAWRPRER